MPASFEASVASPFLPLPQPEAKALTRVCFVIGVIGSRAFVSVVG